MPKSEPGPNLEIWAMKMALRLASKGRGRTSPNPMVGAVVLSNGEIVGRGWHRKAGSQHAEVEALAAAGDRAKGATLFVTLEPCAHTGRTGPCTRQIISAEVSRVVAAVEDPDPRAQGKGFEELRRAGIHVEVGLLQDEAEILNEAYVMHRSLRRPFVVYKVACTFDGKTAAPDGTSRWISDEASRLDVHRLRSTVDAIMVGAETVLKDDPELTVRGVATHKQPLRVVADSQLRVPLTSKVLKGSGSVLIFTSQQADGERLARLKDAGADIVTVDETAGGLSIQQMLGTLAQRDVVTLLLEGGPILAGSFEREQAIDRYTVYLCAKLMGGAGSRGLFEGWGVETMSGARPLRIESVKRLDMDVRLDASPVRAT